MIRARFAARLMAGVSLALLAPIAAHAADTAADTAAETAGAAADNGTAADNGAENSSTANEIVVLGFGQTRQTQTVSASDIALLTPGISPLKAISKLPGVNFQSADPYGAYEWSARISIRGFNQNQLGFTLDGVPLGDMSYGNYNGLHISRAIISEDLGTVTVSQGAGALGTASTSNLGGTLVFTSKDPSHQADAAGSFSYGSDQSLRGFVRLETGDFGPFRAYLSYARLDAGKWKGDGAQKQDQVNAKLVGELGASKLTAWINYSDRRENDYQDMSMAMIDRLGYQWDNFNPDWQLAYATAAVYHNQVAAASSAPLPYPSYGLSFTAPVQTVDDAYFNASGLRQDWLGSARLETPLASNVNLSLQGYYHSNHGQGLWWTPYVASPSGAPLSVRTTEYDIRRGGVIGTLGAEFGAHKLEAGIWYESNDFRQARRYYSLDDVQTGSSRDALLFQSDPFFTQWYYKFQTRTFVYHVSDEITLGGLTVNAGWKGISVTNEANPIVQSVYPTGSIRSRDMFLPQIGLLYRVSANSELFAGYTENMRAFVSAVTSGPFSTTQAGFDAIRNALKPETSKTLEGGARYRQGPFQGSLTAYYVDFSNRLLGVTSGAGIVGNPTILQNVGAVRSYGLEAAATVRLAGGFSATASYAYNNSTYRDNVYDNTGALIAALKGKTVVDSPKSIASAELAYQGAILFGRIGVNYMSRRYYSYLNDASVAGRALVDASIGAKIPEGHGFLSGVAIEASVTNLTDEHYVSTVGSNGFGNSGDGQTLLPGAPRQWFVTLRRGF